MTSLLALPDRELAVCLEAMQTIPRDQHRRFLDVVADQIGPCAPYDLMSEVVSACAYARWLMRELRR
jgi:hypothetical protein